MEVNNKFEGLTVLYANHRGAQVGKFHTPEGDFFWGGDGVRGRFLIQDKDNRTLFEYDAEKNCLILRNQEGVPTFWIDGETGNVHYTGTVQQATQETPTSA